MSDRNPIIKQCSVCRITFECGTGGFKGGCWCNDLPAIMPMDSSTDCLCPACLQKAMKERIEGRNKNS